MADETAPGGPADGLVNDEAYTLLVEYLKNRTDSEIVWGEPHEAVFDPFMGRIYTGWVDVYVPDIQKACGGGWVWTIEDVTQHPPDETEDLPWYTIDLPYDLDVVAVWDPEARTHTGADGQVIHTGDYVLHVASPAGTVLDSDREELVGAALAESGNRSIHRTGGWTAQRVNAALTHWCLMHADRNMTARHDPDQALSGSSVHAAAVIAELEAGLTDTYLIGVTDDGTEIRASSAAFEQLAQLDSAEAAKTMDIVRRLADPDSAA